jgi:hypothetical protein
VRADVRHAALCAVVGRADGLGMTTTSEPPTETGTAAGRDNGSEHARIRQLRRRTLYQDATCPHRGVQRRADKRGSVKHSSRVKTIDSINEFSAPCITFTGIDPRSTSGGSQPECIDVVNVGPSKNPTSATVTAVIR